MTDPIRRSAGYSPHEASLPVTMETSNQLRRFPGRNFPQPSKPPMTIPWPNAVAILMPLMLPIAAVIGNAQEVAKPKTRPALRAVADTEGLLVFDSDRPVFYYQKATLSLGGNWPRANYVHPLYGLDGEILTEDFPVDHRHHRGVFWAWHQVLIGDVAAGDPWICRDFVWDVTDVQASPADQAITVAADVTWKSPQYTDPKGAMIPIVREWTKITAFAATPTYRLIDFEITLLALVEKVHIGGSDDAKGYGGFSPRIKLSDSIRFTGTDGNVEPQNTAVTAGNWINMAGDGYGIAILTHATNPSPRGKFILRRQRSMQNAVYPGREPVALETTAPTVLRYRLVVHRGDLDDNQIDRLQSEYDARSR